MVMVLVMLMSRTMRVVMMMMMTMMSRMMMMMMMMMMTTAAVMLVVASIIRLTMMLTAMRMVVMNMCPGKLLLSPGHVRMRLRTSSCSRPAVQKRGTPSIMLSQSQEQTPTTTSLC